MTRLFKTFSAASFLALSAAVPTLAQEVNIYTTREPGLIQPILDAFTADTGVTVNTVFLQDGLIERVSAEGESSPADILMTVDFGALIDLVDAGLTQPVDSEVLDATVPEALRDAEGNWFALSGRARVLYAAKDLDLGSFTYEQLDDEEWRGRLWVRGLKHRESRKRLSHRIRAEIDAKLKSIVSSSFRRYKIR